MPDLRNAVPDCAAGGKRIQADGNVQLGGEGRDLSRAACLRIKIIEDLDRIVAGIFVWERILARGADPQPAIVVKRQVQRLGDVRLGGDELNLKSRRDVKRFLLVLR